MFFFSYSLTSGQQSACSSDELLLYYSSLYFIYWSHVKGADPLNIMVVICDRDKENQNVFQTLHNTLTLVTKSHDQTDVLLQG